MAAKNQGEVFWRAWIGDVPRSLREQVRLLGGVTEAARVVGRAPSTVRAWIRKEEAAIPKTATDAVREYGGVKEAARAAGVKPRTLQGWLRKERRGEEIGKRQAAHIAKLTDKAASKHEVEKKPKGAQAQLRDKVISSPTARQQAMSSRRAARISHSGAHLSISAKVKVDTGRRGDERWREINLNFRDDVMAEPTQAFLSGNDQATADKLSDAFGQHYAPGTGWNFEEFRGMQIKEFGAGSGGTFPS
ncbi:hypothetical protein [Streptomyces kronopolitis]|uniref:hypothetical protein n=1 Tax=Streptomyces kronopolitis TaxID=1612435 RepID=UPI003D95DF24